ncbi:MAG TPA: hypothetical protein VJ724_15730 [Tahibacter sp.]|nr:hypothetical protein [Tahibacter sp.]
MSQNPRVPNPEILEQLKALRFQQEDEARQRIERTNKLVLRHKLALDEIEGWLMPYVKKSTSDINGFSMKREPWSVRHRDPKEPGPIMSSRIVVSAPSIPKEMSVESSTFRTISFGNFGRLELADRKGDVSPAICIVWYDGNSEAWSYEAFEKLLKKYVGIDPENPEAYWRDRASDE